MQVTVVIVVKNTPGKLEKYWMGRVLTHQQRIKQDD